MRRAIVLSDHLVRNNNLFVPWGSGNCIYICLAGAGVGHAAPLGKFPFPTLYSSVQ